jgi:cell division control protein 6
MILKDGDKLLPSYVPQELPHREKQVQELVNFFRNVVERPEDSTPKFYQLVGPVGSGKTVTALKFGSLIERNSGEMGVALKHVYVNPRQHGASRLMVFRYIVQSVEPGIFSTSYGSEELVIELLKYLKRKNRYLILTFDELDYIVNQSKEPIVYNLTRLNEVLPGQGCNVLGILFTARSTSYYSRLDEAELSSLGRFYERLEPYDSGQIMDILERRCYEAVHPGSVSDTVLRYISEVASPPMGPGDARYALSILYNSCMLAQNQGAAQLGLEHVRHVLNVLSPAITEEELMYLPDEERQVLLAIAKLLIHSKTPYVSFDEIASQVESHSRSGKSRFELKDLVKYVQDLQNRGIIEVKGLTEIGISSVPTNALDRFLEYLVSRLSPG